MPIAFWFMNELQYDRFPDPGVWQEQILLHYCNTSAAANAHILDRMLRAIRDSGVPTLIDTAPFRLRRLLKQDSGFGLSVHRHWDAGNPLAETPKPGRIVNIADGGRPRAVFWKIPTIFKAAIPCS